MRRSHLPLLFFLLTGCGKGDFLAAAPAPAAAVPGVTMAQNFTLYHAYGDSITAGFGVDLPAHIYVALASVFKAVPLDNYAISGDESCDIAARQIFPHADIPAYTSGGLYTLLVGTNDVDVRGPGAGESTFNLCDRAALSWLATPLETKLLATAPNVTVQGASHLETQNNYNALTTDALGAAITFPFTRTVAAPLYLWYRIADANPHTFTCALDGKPVITLATAPSPAIATQNGTTSSVGMYRLASVPAGTHSLQCTQNEAGAQGMGLIAIGGPPAFGTTHLPRVLTGLLAVQLNHQRSSILAAYDTDINTTASLLNADGLDIEVFDAALYMTGTPADMFDDLHPNALGQQEIFKALQQILK